MSTSSVAEVQPPRSEKSSTPSTRVSPAGGSGSAPSIRIRVCRLTGTASTAASRDPARPASATATAVSPCPASGVRRAYREASPCGCSANVTAGHAALPQKNRRTVSRITVRRPPIAASASRREYPLCTRPDQQLHRGHAPPAARTRAQAPARAPSRAGVPPGPGADLPPPPPPRAPRHLRRHHAALTQNKKKGPHRTRPPDPPRNRSEEHTSELQSLRHVVCRLLL